MSVPTITLNDGNRIPQFGLGVFLMPPEETKEHVAFALANGYRHIDTAAIYRNEREVGEAIAESGIPRDEIFVTTKLWNNRQTDAPAALAESLEKLGLDQVDLYLIHWPAPQFDTYVEAWQSMEQLQAQGLTRSIGVSNFHQQHLERLLDAGNIVPAVNQIEVHPSLAQFELVDFNTSLGIVTEAWSPLGQGGDVLSEPPVVEAAAAHGIAPAQAVLAWHVARGSVAIPKASTAEHQGANLAAVTVELSDAEVEAITALGRADGRLFGADPSAHEEM